MDELDDEPREGGAMWALMWRWLPGILLILSVRTYAFEPYNIPSGSMIPTLEIGDRVAVNKLSYGLWAPATGISIPFTSWVPPRFEILDWGDPERGDIIVFRYPRDETMAYIKRVVATGGDHIRVEDNQIVLNGVLQARTLEGAGSSIDAGCHSTPTRRWLEHFESGADGAEHTIFTGTGRGGSLADWPVSGEDLVIPEDTVFVMGDNRDNSADSRAWGLVRFDQIEGKAHTVLFSLDECSGKVRTERLFHSLYSP